MGTKRFQRHSALLQAFSRAKPKLKKAIVKNADPDFIKALIDVVANLLNGNLKSIPPVAYTKLNKRKAMLRKFAQCVKTKSGLKTARSGLNQKGGFLPLLPLLSTLIPIASSVLSSVFQRSDS